VPAWSVPLMPWHFVSSGLASGAGALLALTALAGTSGTPGQGLLLTGVVLALADLVVWWRYLATPPRTASFNRAVAVLRAPANRLRIEGLGRAVPALLLIAALLLPTAAATLGGLAGLLLLAGGLWAKAALITRAAFLVDLFDRFGTAPAANHRAPTAARSASRPMAA